MKKILSIGLLVISLSAFSQEIQVQITKGEVFQDDKKNMEFIMDEDDGNGGQIAIRAYFGGMLSLLQGYYVDHFDAQLNLINRQTLEMKMMSKNAGFIKGISVHDGKVNLVFMRYARKSKELYYSVMTASIGDLDFTEKRILTFDRKDFKAQTLLDMFVNTSPFDVDKELGGYVDFSENKVFGSIHMKLEKDNGNTIKLFVFDRNFDLFYEKDISNVMPSGRYSIHDISLNDSSGEAYVLVKAFKQIERKKKDSYGYHFKLLKLSEKSDFKLSKIETNDRFIGSLNILFKYGKLVCVGYYSNLADHWAKGVIRVNIDPESLTTLNISLQPFSEQLLTDKFAKNKAQEIRNMVLRALFMSPNGDITICSEDRYRVKHMRTNYYGNIANNTGSSVKIIYHYNDIIAAKMSEAGELLWARNINKLQSGRGKDIGYFSYTSTTQNNKVYFLINCKDDVRMLRKDRIEFSEVGINRANLFVISIAENGDFNYKKLIDNKESKISYLTINGVVSNDGSEVILSGVDGKDKQLLKLAF